MTAIRLEGVRVVLGTGPAARGVLDIPDLSLPPSVVTAVVGPSGSGKTTLLRLLAGLLEPQSGRVLFDGRDVSAMPPAQRDVGMAFQGFALYPGHTVRFNLEIPLRGAGVAEAERGRRVAAMAGRLGIARLLQRKVERISGGEQQRVALGRALIRDPRLVLLDEPMSHVDPARRREIVTILKEMMRRDPPPTVILVTHDWAETSVLADHLVVLDRGRVVQGGPVGQVLRAPGDLRVVEVAATPFVNRLEDLRPVPGNPSMLRDPHRGLRLHLDRPLERDRWYVAMVEAASVRALPGPGPYRVSALRNEAAFAVAELGADGRRPLLAGAGDGTGQGAPVALELVGPGWVATGADHGAVPVVARVHGLEMEGGA